MSAKSTYRVRNWSEYNKSLVNRGSITFWFSEEAASNWLADNQSGLRGRPLKYSDIAIECMLVIRSVFHLPLRALQGFVLSLISISNLSLPCPDYTTVCKRMKDLQIMLPQLKPGENLHVLVDSSGLKIFGEGEWKTRKHGVSKRRTWRKLHIAVDANTHCIVGAVLTTNSVGDSEAFGPLMDSVTGEVTSVRGDGAYDTTDCYDTCECYGAVPIIPPRRGGKKSDIEEGLKLRNEAIDALEKLGGDDEARKLWKQQVGYHLRSLAETCFSRYKTVFGPMLSSRILPNQAVESFVRCKALNQMTMLGMPKSCKVT